MELRRLNLRDARAQWEFTSALPADENGLTNPYHGVSWDEYLERVLPEMLSHEHPSGMPDWFVPETYYYLWDGDCLVGEFRLRHHLTQALREGAGHIGYSIRREYRGKGYGTAGLGLLLQIARDIVPEEEIFLRAEKDNIASQKVMLSNGAYRAGGDGTHCFLRIPKGKIPPRFDLDAYLDALIRALRSAFGERLAYVGLQGSRMRGEANENSDIDIMILLDRFSVADMDTYRDILKGLGHYDMSCGFICGREEMARWNPLEVCQLRHTTRDLLGRLDDYLPGASRQDEVNYVRQSLGDLYHEICHRYIHADREKNADKFRGTCKRLFFIIQNLHYLESGRFAVTKAELRRLVTEEDREMLLLAELPDGFCFDSAYAALFAWCQRAFDRIKE